MILSGGRLWSERRDFFFSNPRAFARRYSPRGIFSYTTPSARDAVAATANATQYKTKHRVIRGPAILPVRTTRTNWRDVVGGPREWYGTVAAAAAAAGEKGPFARNSPSVRHMSSDYPAAGDAARSYTTTTTTTPTTVTATTPPRVVRWCIKRRRVVVDVANVQRRSVASCLAFLIAEDPKQCAGEGRVYGFFDYSYIDREL